MVLNWRIHPYQPASSEFYFFLIPRRVVGPIFVGWGLSSAFCAGITASSSPWDVDMISSASNSAIFMPLLRVESLFSCVVAYEPGVGLVDTVVSAPDLNFDSPVCARFQQPHTGQRSATNENSMVRSLCSAALWTSLSQHPSPGRCDADSDDRRETE